MSKLKTNILGNILAVILTITLVTPLLVKLDHLFQDHEHEFCITPYTTHFHKFDVECDFYNFTLNTNFFKIVDSFEFFEPITISYTINSQYRFISEYQKLHLALRGPPLSA